MQADSLPSEPPGKPSPASITLWHWEPRNSRTGSRQFKGSAVLVCQVDGLAAGDEPQAHGSDSRGCPSSGRGREGDRCSLHSGHRKGGAQSGFADKGPVRICSGGMQLALSCSSGITVHSSEERLQGVLQERSPIVLPNIPHTSLATEALFPKAVAIISWGQSLNRNLGKQTLRIIFVVSQPKQMCLQGRGHGLFRASTRQRRQEMHMNPNEQE